MDNEELSQQQLRKLHPIDLRKMGYHNCKYCDHIHKQDLFQDYNRKSGITGKGKYCKTNTGPEPLKDTGPTNPNGERM